MGENSARYFLAGASRRQVKDWQASKYCHADEAARSSHRREDEDISS